MNLPAPAVSHPPVLRRLLVMVPAFNEEAALSGVLGGLPAQVLGMSVEVLVIDDGSADRTAEVARAAGVTVLSLPFNLGIGAAVQSGFKYARAHGHDLAIQFDGDGQHLAGEIGSIVSPVLEGRADVVIGSRFLHEGGFRSTWVRNVGIRFFRAVNSALVGQTITDNTSGFRAYNRRAIEFLAGSYPHDYPEPEAVILLARNGFKLEEVPAEMAPRQGGRSSITWLLAIYYMAKVFLAIVLEACRRRVPGQKKEEGR